MLYNRHEKGVKELKARLRTRQEELGDELSVADAISKLIQSEM